MMELSLVMLCMIRKEYFMSLVVLTRGGFGAKMMRLLRLSRCHLFSGDKRGEGIVYDWLIG